MHGGCAVLQVVASMDPKPVPGDWAGNGAPVKFSTRETREEGKGWFIIQEHMGRLQQVWCWRDTGSATFQQQA